MSTANSEAPANTAADQAVTQRGNSNTTSTAMDEKKARKRQLDRISQRRKRQKDRETMERLKRSLEQPHDPNILHSLVMKQEQYFARVHRHGERMMQMQALLQADLADLDEKQSCGQQDCLSPPSDDNDDTQQAGVRAVSPQEYLNIGSTINNVDPPLQPQLDLDGLAWDDIEVPHMEQPMLSNFLTEAPDNCYLEVPPIITNENPNVDLGMFGSPYDYMGQPSVMQSRDKSIGQPGNRTELPLIYNEPSCVKCESAWRAVNLNIGLARHHHRTNKDLGLVNDIEPDTDAHLIITAIAEGWCVAEQSPFWHEQWSILRQIDQISHGESGDVERLVVLFNLRRMLKYLRFPKDRNADRVPKFLHERPSQLSVPHAAVIDYFVWPGFREHVIFNHQRYCNNDFSRLFAHSIKFLWPYEVRDTYVRNRETNLYHFSRTFLDQADDLRNYSLDSKFFVKYPEFQGDVPIYESLPRICASVNTCDTKWHYLSVNQKTNRLVRSRQIEEVEESVRA